ncbi:hypothetical protein [Novosphingobium pentaromativorans]|uniref:PilZ domain-containing protein n=1 Tax=Novosphingobium pentaromativorans US6-1 TaxID=1088721 RepID=G6EC30_9SPHN|nr:hypothetical protein [Novosphingobium pentaromativorans]AIT80182.1 hypothetical protein JI59_10540 [Novosphingobium pentaromativorans US6-1]EHJ61129.1 hypothetical protein NSU_1901 [Novosphingobium pentaromativorans US6-1]
MAYFDPECGSSPVPRRETREQVEMLAKFRRNFVSSTVLLKDLTRFGAKVEGVGRLCTDEAVSLALPGCRPSMAFVAWANDHSAGLEFADPLDGQTFSDLVARFGLGRSAAKAA